ncbi:MAG: hypothetical protein KC729_14830, partial [Candidatus Eisenbacteria bacterium]|nr:hypothetical protein [Candidatus Eisenbacteria bacterium]
VEERGGLPSDMNAWSHVVAVMVGLSVVGCASIVSRSKYPVTIQTTPAGATVTVRKADGEFVESGPSPLTVELDAGAGYFGRARYRIVVGTEENAERQGFAPREVELVANFDEWYWGNFAVFVLSQVGGLAGFVLIDPMTGAMWELEESVTISLDEAGVADGDRTQRRRVAARHDK